MTDADNNAFDFGGMNFDFSGGGTAGGDDTGSGGFSFGDAFVAPAEANGDSSADFGWLSTTQQQQADNGNTGGEAFSDTAFAPPPAVEPTPIVPVTPVAPHRKASAPRASAAPPTPTVPRRSFATSPAPRPSPLAAPTQEEVDATLAMLREVDEDCASVLAPPPTTDGDETSRLYRRRYEGGSAHRSLTSSVVRGWCCLLSV